MTSSDVSWCFRFIPQPPCVSSSNKHKPRCAVSKHRVVGERLSQLTCLAETEARAGLASAMVECCAGSNASGVEAILPRWRAPEFMKWPTSFLAAVEALLSAERPIDFNFIGAMAGDSTTEARRQWVREFALARFTNASYYVDTTPGVARRGYRPLGPWDHTLRHGRFRPKDATHSGRGGCARVACDLSYLKVLASSRFTLAPMGDQPWSHRYFEALMAGSIPIVESHLHTGRTPEERALPYHYLLAGNLPPPPPPPGSALAATLAPAGRVPYCSGRAAANRATFLQKQTALAPGGRIAPDTAPCQRPPFAMPKP